MITSNQAPAVRCRRRTEASQCADWAAKWFVASSLKCYYVFVVAYPKRFIVRRRRWHIQNHLIRTQHFLRLVFSCYLSGCRTGTAVEGFPHNLSTGVHGSMSVTLTPTNDLIPVKSLDDLWMAILGNTLVFCIFVGLAADVNVSEFKKKFTESNQWRGLFAGVCCQFLILPLVGFTLVKLLDMSKVYLMLAYRFAFSLSFVSTVCTRSPWHLTFSLRVCRLRPEAACDFKTGRLFISWHGFATQLARQHFCNTAVATFPDH